LSEEGKTVARMAMEQRGTAPHKESVVLLAYSEAKKKHYIVAKPAHRWETCHDACRGVLRCYWLVAVLKHQPHFAAFMLSTSAFLVPAAPRPS
jgi:hypothetical protein